MAKFITIGERIHCISPAIREAMATRNPEPILKRAKEQLDAGATYLDAVSYTHLDVYKRQHPAKR